MLLIRDIGAEWPSEQCSDLPTCLQNRLHQPLAVWNENDPTCSLSDAIQSLIDSDIRQLTILPFGLFAIPERGAITQSFLLASRSCSSLGFKIADPLTWMELSDWLRATAFDAITAAKFPPDKTGILVVGASTPNPMTNANLACLAHLIRETGPIAGVQHAFLDALTPTIAEAIGSLKLAGVDHVVVIPWLICGHELLESLNRDLHQATASSGMTAQIAPLQLDHPALINLLVANHLTAVPTDAYRSSFAGDATIAQPNATANGCTADLRQELQELETRIDAMLPSEYHGNLESVSPKSMGSAGLKYDEQGQIAWDEIWTSFCDLALAGGPPHRGTLLEAVTTEQVQAQPQQYAAVVQEIGRGIRLVTSLPIVESKSPGWVGVRCHSEEMAVWLMRAIIVENIMVRREADVIYLPAGPQFTIKREIKNVITAVAKTVHYWTAHLAVRRAMTNASDLARSADFTVNQTSRSES